MVKINPVTRRDVALLAVVLVAATIMRLGHIQTISFVYDDALLSQMAQDTASFKNFPFLGMSASVGIPAPATSVYLMALPYAISDSPIVAAAFIGLLNVIGVGLVWWLGHRYFNPTVALVAGLALAVNPWALTFSRRIWTPDLQLPFLLLAFVVGCLGFVEGKRGARIACLPLFVLAGQIYMWSLGVFPAFLWLAWLGRKYILSKRQFIAEWAVSIVITAVTLIPFAIGVAQTGLFTTINFFQTRQAREVTLSGYALNTAFHYATGTTLEVEVAGKENAPRLVAAVPPATTLWQVVLGAAVVIGVAGAWLRYRAMGIGLTLWLLSIIVILTPTWTDLYGHYFVPVLPTFALFIGIGVDAVIAWMPKPNLRMAAMAGLGLILAAVFVLQAVWWFGMLNYIDQNYPSPSYGTPAFLLMGVKDQMASYKDVVIVTNDYWDKYDKEPVIWEVLLRNSAQCIRAIGGNSLAVFPPRPFAVLVTPIAQKAPVADFYKTAAPQVISLRPNEGQYTIETFDQAPAWNGPAMTEIPPAELDSGVQLSGYHLDNNLMYLEWTLNQNHGRDYQYFGHFLDAAGNRIGQRDTVFLPGHYWCSGDRIITWIDIQLPPATATLRVGMYQLGHGPDEGKVYPTNVLDSANNPVSQWVDIPLNK